MRREEGRKKGIRIGNDRRSEVCNNWSAIEMKLSREETT